MSEWLDVWHETKKYTWKITTQKSRKDLIEDIYKPNIGKYSLSKLDVMTYEREFINILLETYTPGTVKNHHNIFKVAINAAVTNEIIPRNRFKSLKIIDNDIKKINFLSSDELSVLISITKVTASETIYTFILLLAYTGMRKGEAHGLKWSDIDFEKQIIKIERTRDIEGARSPKTQNSYRTVHIDENLAAHLKTYRTWCKQLKLSQGEYLEEDEYILLTVTGPIHPMTINRALDNILDLTEVTRITPHGFRHTHATILLNTGTSVSTIAKRLGNTAEEIHRTYGHSDDAADLKAVETFLSSMSL